MIPDLVQNLLFSTQKFFKRSILFLKLPIACTPAKTNFIFTNDLFHWCSMLMWSRKCQLSKWS